MPIRISPRISLADDEITVQAIRAQGAGGQNVNKVATAIELRFDIARSSLPDDLKARMLAKRDRRRNREGILRIKAQRYRTRERNRRDAIDRLIAAIRSIIEPPRPRRETKIPAAQKRKRLEDKARRAKLKADRARPADSN